MTLPWTWMDVASEKNNIAPGLLQTWPAPPTAWPRATTIIVARNFFRFSIKRDRDSPRHIQPLPELLQSGALWRTETSVIRWGWVGWFARQGVERGRCGGPCNDLNESRTHSGRNGTTRVNPETAKVIDINEYRWQKHCRGLFQLPMAA